jgi:hypothetical protein
MRRAPRGAAVTELAPDAPATAVIAVNLAYLDAIEAEDAVALERPPSPRPRRFCRRSPTTCCCSGW